ncbi:MAG: hypothetical protein R3275_13915, partial [Saprospiraceae bacterium]|nr:hypothetical protein [Saprospiraceae bacterium]
CQAMKRQTLKNTQVTDILNDHFNFISFDAEYRSPIEFDGNTYYFRKTGRENGVHELAEAMGTVNGKLDFPIFLVFNKENGLVFRYAGFLRSEDLIVVLNDVNQKED